ncbi:MAG: hypothetical protein WCK91_02665 [bacterium]
MEKSCQQCQNTFNIDAEDASFYGKMDVPHPTFCPECRLIHRTLWRNEKTLYRRECDLCHKNMISIYSSDSPHLIYCRECFHKDSWDSMSYGVDIDFSKPFLVQLHELQLKVPRISSFVFQNVNSEYVNGAAFNKNCYMLFVSDYDEDCMYSYASFKSHTSSDLLNCNECEMCYECVTCTKCYQTLYSEDCSNSQNLIFCKNCNNCQDCIGCVNLKNVRYAIFNKVVSKEEYKEYLDRLLSRKFMLEVKKKAQDLQADFPVKYFHGMRNVDVVGDYVSSSKNSQYVFDSDDLEDCKYINHGHQAKDSQDSYVLVDKSERSYQIISGIALNNTVAGNCVWQGYDIFYSDTCENSHHLFGCVGLKKKEYCIFNKQYTKEEYEQFVPKIIEHMKNMPYTNSKGLVLTYGDFFPSDFSPFAYNETAAMEYKSLSKEEALSAGFKWKEKDAKAYNITLQSENNPDSIKEVQDSVLGEIIECAHKGTCNDSCATAFKVTPEELALCRRLNIPLPTLCFNCRHGERIQIRNPRTIYDRQCMCTQKTHVHGDTPCEIKIETTYSPDRKEVVYCEACYQQEVA